MICDGGSRAPAATTRRSDAYARTLPLATHSDRRAISPPPAPTPVSPSLGKLRDAFLPLLSACKKPLWQTPVHAYSLPAPSRALSSSLSTHNVVLHHLGYAYTHIACRLVVDGV